MKNVSYYKPIVRKYPIVGINRYLENTDSQIKPIENTSKVGICYTTNS